MTPPTVSSTWDDKSSSGHTGGTKDSTTPHKKRGVARSASSKSTRSNSSQKCNKEQAKGQSSSQNTLPSHKRHLKEQQQQQEESDPFQLPRDDDPFAADPFQLAKPFIQQPAVGNTKKPETSSSSDPLGPSFHMTNHFGDFGNDSFGHGSMDSSNSDFKVVQPATPKSLLFPSDSGDNDDF
jgi:hypothetical protein